jgi:predicted HicB family RNase H-like nuclease
VSRTRGDRKRFSYLAAAGEPSAAEREQLEVSQESADAEKDDGGGPKRRDREEEREDTRQKSRNRRKPAAQQLASVPKGEGRMKQERSQLNVRIPTALKRQASAKAVLEGKDIGEVVEELLRQYLER